MINLQIVLFTTIGLEVSFSTSGLRFKRIFPDLDPFMSLLFDHLLQTTVISSIGIILLYLGKRSLAKSNNGAEKAHKF